MGEHGEESLRLPGDEWRFAETLRLLGFEMQYEDDDRAHLVVTALGGDGWPSQQLRIAMQPLRAWLGHGVNTVVGLQQALAARGVRAIAEASWPELRALLRRGAG